MMIDLLAQAEHDECAQATLITPDAAFADTVIQAVEAELRVLSRSAIAGESWARNGAVLISRDMQEAVELANRLAPEHLELMVDDRSWNEWSRHADMPIEDGLPRASVPYRPQQG